MIGSQYINHRKFGSVFLYHIPESNHIIVINWRNCCNQLSFFQFLVFKGNTPVLLVAVVPQSPFHHIKCHPYDIPWNKLRAIIGACWVAIMSSLPVVDSPTIDWIWESFFQLSNGGSADSNLDELSFVNKDLKVVSSSFSEYFCAHGSFEPVAFCGFCPETLRI